MATPAVQRRSQGPISRPTRACAHIFGVPGPPAPILAPVSLMSEKSKRNLVKPRSRPFRSGWSPPSAGLSGSRGFSRAAIRACRRLRPEVGREGDHGVARSGRVRASLASVPRSALADAFGPRSAARLSATSGLGRWFLPRARTRVSDGKLVTGLPIRAALLSLLRLCTPRLQSKLTISTQFAPFPAGYLPISVRAPLASSIV